MTSTKPRILITLGDIAGIGPEIVVKAWQQLTTFCRPVAIGDPAWLQRGAAVAGSQIAITPIQNLAEASESTDQIVCLNASHRNLNSVQAGKVSAEAGGAAYDWLCFAIDEALANRADAIVTAPLHKEGLHAAGVKHPGHTEILAERTGTQEFAMVLYGDGIAVAHVTLHMALRDTFQHITTAAVEEKIGLLDDLLKRLLDRSPRIGVAALNPHGGDGGLFGDEEARIILPAVEAAQRRGITTSGPHPADTLFVRAHKGEFDGVVAMYHDEGHIAMKLRCGPRCVNISAGLPIVRTSVAHGTAYDIVGRGIADAGSLVSAAEIAAKLSLSQKR